MRSRIHGQMVCVKYFLFISNFLVWLSGLGLIIIGGFGELLYGDVNEFTSRTSFTTASAVIIAIGTVIAIVGFAGCYGSIRENFGTLKFFSYALAVIILVELALGLWIYFSHIRVFTVLKQFESEVISKYELDKDVEKLIDKVQKKFQCCGARHYNDWFNSEWNKNRQNSSSTWINNVPQSCCLSNTTDVQTCGDNLDTDSRPAFLYVHQQGCFQFIEAYLKKHIGTAIFVGAVIVTFQVAAMFLSCSLRRSIKVAFHREFRGNVVL